MKPVEEFKRSLRDWTDQRFATREDLFCMAMFHLYIVNLLEAYGWSYRGHSYRYRLPLGNLVVKATINGVPMVVFTTGATTISCIRIFFRKMEEDRLMWVKDKYP